MKIIAKSTSLYRNFGWNEYLSIKKTRQFLIHPNNFQAKQFWIGKTGLKMWLNSSFAKEFTVKITIPTEYVTPGNKNYLFMETNATIDQFPGGTIRRKNLTKFNKVITIVWFEY
jgi:hypothetical protein